MKRTRLLSAASLVLLSMPLTAKLMADSPVQALPDAPSDGFHLGIHVDNLNAKNNPILPDLSRPWSSTHDGKGLAGDSMILRNERGYFLEVPLYVKVSGMQDRGIPHFRVISGSYRVEPCVEDAKVVTAKINEVDRQVCQFSNGLIYFSVMPSKDEEARLEVQVLDAITGELIREIGASNLVFLREEILATQVPDNSERPASLLGTPRTVDQAKLIFQKSDLSDVVIDKVARYYINHRRKIKNRDYVSVVDFTKSSGEKRYYLFNMGAKTVQMLYTSHGRGSGTGKSATKFSNVSGSNTSSLGFMITGKVYTGKFGRSLNIHGQESRNNRVHSRRIVIHGFSGVNDRFAQSYGRVATSLGRFMIDLDKVQPPINKVRNGSLLYAFHESHPL